MRLRRILIEDFRNLRHLEIRPRRTTLVLGENDAGKSNLLHALRLLLDREAERLRVDLSAKDINEEARAEGRNGFTITVEIGELQKHVEVEACFRERIDEDGGETFVTIRGTFAPDADGEYVWKSDVLPPRGRSNDPMPLTRSMASRIPMCFLDATRDAARDTRATGRGLFAQLLDELDCTDVQAEVVGHLREANRALGKGQELAELSQGLSRLMAAHVFGGQGEVSITVPDEDVDHLVGSLRLGIRRWPDGPSADISRHGTGIQNLALVSIFRHQVAVGQHRAAMLAIEEPEAHLHPHAQRSLYADLAQIGIPTILTTHSPEIVGCADPRDLVLLRAKPCGGSESYQLEEAAAPSDVKVLTDLLRKGRASTIFARSIIVFEGASEGWTLPAFAQALGCDLDRESVSLVPVDGNDFGHFLRVFREEQLSIPTIVVYDSDALALNNSLLQTACYAGLISTSERDACRGQSHEISEQRATVLQSIGWIAAIRNHEEEICRSGYLDTVIQAIDDADPESHRYSYALARCLQNAGSRSKAEIVGAFLCASGQGKELKTRVARAVAEAVPKVRQVPECYARAIRKAVVASRGGIRVDRHFERRACAAGFRQVIWKMIDTEGARQAFEQHVSERLAAHQTAGVCTFMSDSPVGRALRVKTKEAIADAVASAGCPEYACAIRDAPLPPAENGDD